MRLKALTAQEAADTLGISHAGDDLASLGDVAHRLRMHVAVRGAVHERDLLDSVVSNMSLLSGGRPDIRQRAAAMLNLLKAAGDLVSISTAYGEMILTPPEELIQVDQDWVVIIGGHDAAVDLNQKRRSESVLRIRDGAASGRLLHEYLGQPSYRSILENHGLPFKVDLAQAVDLLAAKARSEGEPVAVHDVTIWGWIDPATAFGVLEDGREAVLAVSPDGSARAIAGMALARWAAVHKRGASLLTCWDLGPDPSGQLLRALAVFGRPTDDTLRNWSIGKEAMSLLSSWIGLTDWIDQEARVPDPDQDSVVRSPASARLLVEAPPGSGKTWTACRRVSYLLDQGVPATRIWMLSFTRAAVAVMRARIRSFLDSPEQANDVRIITIDSLAWRLRNGFSEDEPAQRNHDAGIRETTELLNNGDPGLINYISGIEHLVVDEAQDLNGPRAALIASLIRRLPSSCGVTVFHDPAQAIYAFSKTGPEPLLPTLLNNGALGFQTIYLRTDHRTQDPKLTEFYGSLRRMVLDEAVPAASRYDEVRSAIESGPVTLVPPAGHQQLGTAGSGTFILFRSRAEMLEAASDLWTAGRDFRVRFTRRQEIVEAWIGAVLGSCMSDNIDRSCFDRLWAQLRPSPLLSRDEAWTKLRRVAGSGKGSIDLLRLAARLADGLPPLEVQQTDLGTPAGPLLTTIHGAKGREADEVHLMLPRRPAESQAQRDWTEEAKVLFVGATRARSRLYVGSSSSFFQKQQETDRRWQRWSRGGRNDIRIEVGLDADVDWSPPKLEEDGTAAAQTLLWRHAFRPAPLRAEREGGSYMLKIDGGYDDGRRVGRLTAEFDASLRNIARQAAGAGAYPSSRIRGFHMVAARTVAGSTDTNRPRFWLAPVIAGLPVVFINQSRQVEE